MWCPPAPQESNSRRRKLSSDGRMRVGWELGPALEVEEQKSAHSAARKAGREVGAEVGLGLMRTTAGQSE